MSTNGATSEDVEKIVEELQRLGVVVIGSFFNEVDNSSPPRSVDRAEQEASFVKKYL